MLAQGSPAPAGFVYTGTFSQTMPRGAGRATSLMIDVYVKQ
jgi:hypothetical protein